MAEGKLVASHSTAPGEANLDAEHGAAEVLTQPAQQEKPLREFVFPRSIHPGLGCPLSLSQRPDVPSSIREHEGEEVCHLPTAGRTNHRILTFLLNACYDVISKSDPAALLGANLWSIFDLMLYLIGHSTAGPALTEHLRTLKSCSAGIICTPITLSDRHKDMNHYKRCLTQSYPDTYLPRLTSMEECSVHDSACPLEGHMDEAQHGSYALLKEQCQTPGEVRVSPAPRLASKQKIYQVPISPVVKGFSSTCNLQHLAKSANEGRNTFDTRISSNVSGLRKNHVVTQLISNAPGPNQQVQPKGTHTLTQPSSFYVKPNAVADRASYCQGDLPGDAQGYGRNASSSALSNLFTGYNRAENHSDSPESHIRSQWGRFRSPRNAAGEDRRPYPCVFHKWNQGIGDPTPHCQTFQSYVSRLAPHHRRRHPQSFLYCTKCFRIDFSDERQVSLHQEDSGCSFRCVTEDCRNYDLAPPYVNLCMHGLLNSQRFIWKKLYRLAHGLSRYASVPDPGLLDDQPDEVVQTIQTQPPASFTSQLASADSGPTQPSQFAPDVASYAGRPIIHPPANSPSVYPLPPADNAVNVRDRSWEVYEFLVSLAVRVWQSIIQQIPYGNPQDVNFHMSTTIVGSLDQPIAHEHPELTIFPEILELRSLLRTYNQLLLRSDARTPQAWDHIAEQTRRLLGDRVYVPTSMPWLIVLTLGGGRMNQQLFHPYRPSHANSSYHPTSHVPQQRQQHQSAFGSIPNIMGNHAQPPVHVGPHPTLNHAATSYTAVDGTAHSNHLLYLDQPPQPTSRAPWTTYDLRNQRTTPPHSYQYPQPSLTTPNPYNPLSMPRHEGSTHGSGTHTYTQSYQTHGPANDSGYATFNNDADDAFEEEEDKLLEE